MTDMRMIHTAHRYTGGRLLKELIANNTDLKNGDIIVNVRLKDVTDIYVYCDNGEPALTLLETRDRRPYELYKKMEELENALWVLDNDL